MVSRIILFAIGVAIVVTGLAGYCYSEDVEDTGKIKTAQGKVTAMDWVGSVITVEGVEFFVPSDVAVKKGLENMSFSAVNVGDNVSITYSKKQDGSLKAVKINVSYSGEMPT